MVLKGCGLMQEKDDIQHDIIWCVENDGCGLMQEKDDIQHYVVVPAI